MGDAATHVCYGSDVLAMRILDGVEVNESGKVHLSFALTSSVSLRLSSACKVRSKDLARCDDKFIQCTGMVPVIIDSTEKSVRFKMQCHQEQLADDRWPDCPAQEPDLRRRLLTSSVLV